MRHGQYRLWIAGLVGGILMAAAAGCLEGGGAAITEKLNLRRSESSKTSKTEATSADASRENAKTSENTSAKTTAEKPSSSSDSASDSSQPAGHIEMTIDGQYVGKNVGRKMDVMYELAKPVSLSPTLRFSFTDKAYFGRVQSAIINIWKADEEGQPKFIIAPADNKPESAMKPGVNYKLGALPANLKVMEGSGKMAEVVKFQPATQYKLVFVVSGGQSETMIVQFKTK